jgi:hypothetical protein
MQAATRFITGRPRAFPLESTQCSLNYTSTTGVPIPKEHPKMLNSLQVLMLSPVPYRVFGMDFYAESNWLIDTKF